jgi:hypothetical protein
MDIRGSCEMVVFCLTSTCRNSNKRFAIQDNTIVANFVIGTRFEHKKTTLITFHNEFFRFLWILNIGDIISHWESLSSLN